MSDNEMTELCLAAMGWKHLGAVGVEPPKRGEPDPKGLWCLSGGNDWWLNPEGHSVCAPCYGLPDPLHDDAQAMALVKRFQLQVGWHSDTGEEEGDWYASESVSNWAYSKVSLNCAICECVAKLQTAKAPPQ